MTPASTSPSSNTEPSFLQGPSSSQRFNWAAWFRSRRRNSNRVSILGPDPQSVRLPSSPWDSGSAGRRNDRPRTAAEASRTSYYGVPVVHKPHWKWLIIVYFFLGGISGASYAIAAVAGLLDRRGNAPIVAAGRYIAFATLLPCPVLLILDLGRPERFLMMLRVIKLRSPMSLGTWALTAFGGFSAFANFTQAASDGRLGPALARRGPSPQTSATIALAGTPVALFVAGYTGILLAATAVPLWTKRAVLLGPLFLSSAVSTAAATISLVLTARLSSDQSAPLISDPVDRLDRFAALSSLTELALLTAWVKGLGTTARPLTDGRTGQLLRHVTITAGLVPPIVLASFGERLPIRIRRLMGYVVPTLALSGGFVLRYAVVVAGSVSADDPHATFALTKAGHRGPHPNLGDDLSA